MECENAAINKRTPVRYLCTDLNAILDSHTESNDILRHFVASELASQGESIYVISKLLGHANVVTSERYSHVSNLATKRASDNIGTVIQNTLDKVS